MRYKPTALVLTALVTLMLLPVTAAGAQQDSDPLAGLQAQVSNTNVGAEPNELGPIDVQGCTATDDAILVVRDEGGTRVTVSNQDNDFLVDRSRITVTGPNGEDLIAPIEDDGDDGEFSVGLATIVQSTGITCGDDDDGGDGDQGGAGGGATDRQYGNDDGQRNGDGQGNADRQYGKPVIIKKTIVKGLPKTGGPSPLLLPLAAAFVVAGIAVVRRS